MFRSHLHQVRSLSRFHGPRFDLQVAEFSPQEAPLAANLVAVVLAAPAAGAPGADRVGGGTALRASGPGDSAQRPVPCEDAEVAR